MKIEKSGILLGAKLYISDNHACCSFYMKFADGQYDREVRDDESPSKVLNMLISKYDLAVPNMGVKFACFDYDRNIAFQCCIWDGDTEFLGDIINMFDGKMHDYVSGIFAGIKPNADIVNYGLAADMNGILIVDSIHGNRDGLSLINSRYNSRPMMLSPSEWKFFKDMLRSSRIKLAENVVVSFKNDWNNEGWNGPQCFGGFMRLDSAYGNNGYSDYDFSAGALLEREGGQNLVWDENTCIELAGNQSTEMQVLCPLKNIPLFKPWLDSSETFDTGLIYDINMLMEVDYERHGLEKAYLINIADLITTFDEHDEYIRKRCSELTDMCVYA